MAEHFSANLTVEIAAPAAHKLDARLAGDARQEVIEERGAMTGMRYARAPNSNLAEGVPCLNPILAKLCPTPFPASTG